VSATRKGRLPAALVGLGFLVATLLLLGLGALLSVATTAVGSPLNGVEAPAGFLAIAALVLLGAALLLGDKAFGDAYLATLWATAPFLPGVAAAAVFVACFTLPSGLVDLPAAALYLGGGAALVVWIVSAVPLRGLACVDTAQTYSYAWLRQRTIALAARIKTLDPAFRLVPTGNEPATGPHDAATEVGVEQLGMAGTLRQAEGYVRLIVRELGMEPVFGMESELGMEPELGKPDPGKARPRKKEPATAGCPRSGVRYVSATGYLDLWRLVYKAEEALLGLDDAWAIKEAVYDDLRLGGSTIANQVRLRAELKAAVAVLDADAARRYLEPDEKQAQPQAAPAGAAAGTPPAAPPAPRRRTRQAGSRAAAQTAPSQAAPADATPALAAPAQTQLQEALQAASQAVSQVMTLAAQQPPSQTAKQVARAVLRDVRQAVNEDRGDQWCGIVRARNRLLRTTLLAGLAAFLVLALAVLGDASRTALIGAGAFFVVGALVGLFARLHAEGQNETAADDYGLFEARLIATPLLSGLGAVAGVFLVAIGAPMLASASGTPGGMSLATMFDLSQYPLGLLWAAVFGLTPELLLKELQAYGDKRLKELDSSGATGARSTGAQ
jgi:hypothetical protein